MQICVVKYEGHNFLLISSQGFLALKCCFNDFNLIIQLNFHNSIIVVSLVMSKLFYTPPQFYYFIILTTDSIPKFSCLRTCNFVNKNYFLHQFSHHLFWRKFCKNTQFFLILLRRQFNIKWEKFSVAKANKKLTHNTIEREVDFLWESDCACKSFMTSWNCEACENRHDLWTYKIKREI